MNAQAMLDTYRAELFGSEDGEEPPFWVSVNAPDGSARDEAEALRLVGKWWGELEDGESWKVARTRLHVYEDEYGDLRVNPKPREGSVGPLDFWVVDLDG